MRCAASSRGLAAGERARHDFGFVARSGSMDRFVRQLEALAPSEAPVLILGESGVGKYRAAMRLWQLAGCRESPRILRTMALDPEELDEVVRDAVGPGRMPVRKNLLVVSGLEELGPNGQIELLRTLWRIQHAPRAPRLVGLATEELPLLVQRHRFRKDLYWLFCGVRLRLPPLRERKADLEDLASELLAQPSMPPPPERLTEPARAALRAYSWPGNGREFAAVLRHASLRARGGELDTEHVWDLLAAPQGQVIELPVGLGLGEVEGRYLAQTLAACGGNKSRAAAALGIARRTLYLKLARHEAGLREATGEGALPGASPGGDEAPGRPCSSEAPRSLSTSPSRRDSTAGPERKEPDSRRTPRRPS